MNPILALIEARIAELEQMRTDCGMFLIRNELRWLCDTLLPIAREQPAWEELEDQSLILEAGFRLGGFRCDVPDVRGTLIGRLKEKTRIDREQVLLEETFRKLADEWKKDTLHLSDVSRIIGHPAYRRISGLGKSVVPLILKEMAKEPGHWFKSLRRLTGGLNPVKKEDAGNMTAMTEAWLQWGREQGFDIG